MCACRELAQLTSVGMDALNNSDCPKALTYLNRALARAEEVGSVVLQAKTRNNLGLVHLKAGQSLEAAECFARAKEQLADRIGVDNKLFRTVDANHAQSLGMQPAMPAAGLSAQGQARSAQLG